MILFGDVLAWLTFGCSAVFCLVYGLNGTWYKRRTGRLMMSGTAVVAFVFGWICLRMLYRPTAPPVSVERVVVYGMTAAVEVYRLYVLIRVQLLGLPDESARWAEKREDEESARAAE